MWDEEKKIFTEYDSCELCPRRCRVNRNQGERGFCRAGADIRAARAALHMW